MWSCCRGLRSRNASSQDHVNDHGTETQTQPSTKQCEQSRNKSHLNPTFQQPAGYESTCTDTTPQSPQSHLCGGFKNKKKKNHNDSNLSNNCVMIIRSPSELYWYLLNLLYESYLRLPGHAQARQAVDLGEAEIQASLLDPYYIETPPRQNDLY